MGDKFERQESWTSNSGTTDTTRGKWTSRTIRRNCSVRGSATQCRKIRFAYYDIQCDINGNKPEPNKGPGDQTEEDEPKDRHRFLDKSSGTRRRLSCPRTGHLLTTRNYFSSLLSSPVQPDTLNTLG